MTEESVWERLEEAAWGSTLVQSSRHAAGLVWKRRLMVVGNNKLKSHPMMQVFNDNPEKVYLHAEMDCLVKGINLHGVEWLTECRLFVLRLNKGGQRAMSKPCDGCMKAIRAFDVREVRWTE